MDSDAATLVDAATQPIATDKGKSKLDDHELSKGLDIDKLNQVLNGKSKEKQLSASQEVHEPINGKEKLVDQLREAIKLRDVNTRSALGQVFTDFLNTHPEEKHKYMEDIKANHKRGSVTEAKRRFRLQWAESTLEKWTVTKSACEEWNQIDEETGTYEPLEKIIEHEGGMQSPSAVQAGLLYASKAMHMGGAWISWNPMTERTDILYVKKTMKTLFAKKWKIFKQQSMTTQETVPSSEQAVQEEPPAKKPKLDEASASVDPCKPKASPQKAAGKPKAGSTTKKLTSLLNQAKTVKARYQQISTSYRGLAVALINNHEYDFMNVQKAAENLKVHWEAVEKAAEDTEGFNKYFLMNEIAELKIRFAEADIEKCLPKFLDIDKPLTKLKQEIQRINKLHAASLKG